jgi:hypothetical protein
VLLRSPFAARHDGHRSGGHVSLFYSHFHFYYLLGLSCLFSFMNCDLQGPSSLPPTNVIDLTFSDDEESSRRAEVRPRVTLPLQTANPALPDHGLPLEGAFRPLGAWFSRPPTYLTPGLSERPPNQQGPGDPPRGWRGTQSQAVRPRQHASSAAFMKYKTNHAKRRRVDNATLEPSDQRRGSVKISDLPANSVTQKLDKPASNKPAEPSYYPFKTTQPEQIITIPEDAVAKKKLLKRPSIPTSRPASAYPAMAALPTKNSQPNATLDKTLLERAPASAARSVELDVIATNDQLKLALRQQVFPYIHQGFDHYRRSIDSATRKQLEKKVSHLRLTNLLLQNMFLYGLSTDLHLGCTGDMPKGFYGKPNEE